MSMLLICVSAVNLNKHFFQLKIGLCLLSKSQDHSGQNKFTNPYLKFKADFGPQFKGNCCLYTILRKKKAREIDS